MKERPSCPVCRQDSTESPLLPVEAIDSHVRSLLSVNARGWAPSDPICRTCLGRFREVATHLSNAYPGFAGQAINVLPTNLRLGATDRWRGRRVTIAFIDSGFYAHPDLVKPRNRILKYVSVVGRTREYDLLVGDVSSWHGMMTAVVAAGNGFLSGGIYRGLASEARLVLVKAGSAARVKHENITAGLRWVIRNRRKYGIRIVNISCGGDHERTYLADTLCQAAEEATHKGLVVVAAVGNAGNQPGHQVVPPASAPSVITVGGLDDRNNLDTSDVGIYRSSYGPTVDGLQKPEIIAPGIWIAAPILPGSPTAKQAELLSKLQRAGDDEFRGIIESHSGIDEHLDQAIDLPPPVLRNVVWVKLRDNNVISSHYKHVDGTSFAASIVSSVAAQIIEAVPSILPQEVKLALIRTARRIPNVPVDLQGWGTVDPDAAITEARRIHGRGSRTR